MRILHVAFENFQDVPGLLSRSHKFFGDEGYLVTMVHSRLGFPEGILLNYPLLSSSSIRFFRKVSGRENVNVLEDELRLKIKGETFFQRLFFGIRDMLWLYRLHTPWHRYGLGDFDVYHFDGDVPFIYGDRILKKLKNKHIITHFFGTELRKFGMNPYLKERAELKFTSELDHTVIEPSLIFVPIPFMAEEVTPRKGENKILRVGHSPTRRGAKGTSDILQVVERLKKKIKFEFLLIEGVSHKRCMELKRTCDIGIDQIGSYAGTGYGRSGLEFLALGIPTITEIPERYEGLLPGQPFVKATKENLEDVLYRVLTDPGLRQKKREEGLKWIRDFHHPRQIIKRIYSEYKRVGIIS